MGNNKPTADGNSFWGWEYCWSPNKLKSCMRLGKCLRPVCVRFVFHLWRFLDCKGKNYRRRKHVRISHDEWIVHNGTCTLFVSLSLSRYNNTSRHYYFDLQCLRQSFFCPASRLSFPSCCSTCLSTPLVRMFETKTRSLQHLHAFWKSTLQNLFGSSVHKLFNSGTVRKDFKVLFVANKELNLSWNRNFCVCWSCYALKSNMTNTFIYWRQWGID